jgi:hypothetical protein
MNPKEVKELCSALGEFDYLALEEIVGKVNNNNTDIRKASMTRFHSLGVTIVLLESKYGKEFVAGKAMGIDDLGNQYYDVLVTGYVKMDYGLIGNCWFYPFDGGYSGVADVGEMKTVLGLIEEMLCLDA